MKSILDPDFRYVPSAETDLRKTFARIRKEQRAEIRKIESRLDNVMRIFEERRNAAATKA